ncbi:uncharacterized protein BJ171DRAFT_268853 [Polychytrium aggregatum]|uniref:uncharacterized protein n=1 Tax=Polychytrium aggregatum TaxID=110093 RepID=UPI0022FE431F|nr:uncharacterized protein BJ171DRAFT_268853 [Polychytrium aggregatum]KAI9193376.1 hypothetical protein BJ171DRAFT_268853 [Polychytrium aggregatum]
MALAVSRLTARPDSLALHSRRLPNTPEMDGGARKRSSSSGREDLQSPDAQLSKRLASTPGARDDQLPAIVSWCQTALPNRLLTCNLGLLHRAPAPPASFYGSSRVSSRHEETHAKRWAQVLKTLKVVGTPHSPRQSTLMLFKKQELAFEYQRTCSNPVHVFSFETDISNPGKRKFLATTYPHFWEHYLTLDQRHYYEVIKEGMPCKLYFDLEFMTQDNPNLDHERVMATFIQLLLDELLNKFGIRCRPEHIVDLSSTTTSKFSRHIIVNLPGAVFQDNGHVGRFVSYLISRIHEYSQGNGETSVKFAELIVKHPSSGRAVFIDESVYSKNRNFRIIYSSKIGKSSPLLRADKPALDQRIENETFKFFKESLVCAVEYDDDLRLLSFGESPVLRFPGPLSGRSNDAAQTTSSQPSPFPQIDEYVLRSIQSRNPRACFRSATYFPESKSLVYAIGNDRFCFNIGRQHKSNGVYYVASLNNGTFTQR